MSRTYPQGRPASVDSQDTSLAKAIKHYREREGNAPDDGQSSYASGALMVLLKVKDLRDSYREEMRQAWRDRATDGAGRYYWYKSFLTELDNLMLP